MKKFKSIIVFSLLAFSFSCSEDITEDAVENTSEVTIEKRFMEMQADPEFLKFEKLQDELIQEMFAILEENNIAPNALYDFYKSGNSKKINELFKDQKIIRIKDELALVTSYMQRNYNDIIEVPTQEFTDRTIEIGLQNLKDIENYAYIKRRGCSWRYTLCAAAATTAYTACMATVGTATGGLAALACTAAYAYTMTECHRKHCD
ncbi:hypothetical protein [Aquimarina sp. RZ0]|uniref:hypothetical protein n=1 Tax=Aquimarina sp. RZ0 TaxID=2607730 RepID=UPI0011F2EFC4|nr:hypothetical protein [Aquimarina sp. RZ0]KAA1247281.1 hypothetical protein F0000_03805 [Aquimarina sp. RZ0]